MTAEIMRLLANIIRTGVIFAVDETTWRVQRLAAACRGRTGHDCLYQWRPRNRFRYRQSLEQRTSGARQQPEGNRGHSA